MLDKGKDVGQNLARVKFVGQAIDDRHTRVGGKTLQTGLLEGTNHDDIDHARNHAGGIFNRFGAAQLRVGGGQVNDRTAHLNMPASKLTRVRVLAFSNTMASVRSCSGMWGS